MPTCTVLGGIGSEAMNLAINIRSCDTIFNFTHTGPGVADVGDVTLPFTPPEVMDVANGRQIPLAASMDVLSLRMVIMQATSRMSFLTSDHEASVDVIYQHLLRAVLGEPHP